MRKTSKDEFKPIATFKEWEYWQILDIELEKLSDEGLDDEFYLALKEQKRVEKRIEVIQRLRFSRHPEWTGHSPILS